MRSVSFRLTLFSSVTGGASPVFDPSSLSSNDRKPAARGHGTITTTFDNIVFDFDDTPGNDDVGSNVYVKRADDCRGDDAFTLRAGQRHGAHGRW